MIGFLIAISTSIFSMMLVVWIWRRFNAHVDYKEFIYENGKKYYFRITSHTDTEEGDNINKFIIKTYKRKFIAYEISSRKINKIDDYTVKYALKRMMENHLQDLENEDIRNLKDFDGFVGNVPEHIIKQHGRKDKLKQLGIVDK